MSYGAAMCLLRGRAYAGLDNRARAAAWFRAALRADPFCHEAFQARLAPGTLWGIIHAAWFRGTCAPTLSRGLQVREISMLGCIFIPHTKPCAAMACHRAFKYHVAFGSRCRAPNLCSLPGCVTRACSQVERLRYLHLWRGPGLLCQPCAQSLGMRLEDDCGSTSSRSAQVQHLK